MNYNFVGVLLFVAASISWADTLLIADTLEVRDSRNKEQRLTLSQESSYRKVAIESSLQGNNLSRILSQSPGITTKKSGAVGSFQTVTIRGTEGKRVAVYLNGVPQMSSLGGAVDLSRFAGLNIQEVEVYRGFSPAKLGGNSLGGVINIITDSSGNNKEFSFLAGSFGEFEGRAILQDTKETLSYGGMLTYHTAENNYRFWSRNGTPYNNADDYTDTMQNNAFSAFTTQATLTQKLSNQRELSFNATFEKRSRELPAPEGAAHNQTAKWYETGFTFYNRFSKAFNTGAKCSGALSIAASEGVVQWSALDNFRVFFGNPQEGEIAKMFSKSFKIEGSPTVSFFIGDKLLSENRVDLIYERVRPETNQDGYGIGDWKSNDLRGKLCSDIRYFGEWGNFFVGGTVEVDHSRNEGGSNGHFTFELPPMRDTALVWAVQGGLNLTLADEKVLLFSNLGRFSRLPSIQERFGFHGSVLPNPTIKPEAGLNSEIGISLSTPKVTLESILFYNRHKELITFIYDGITGRSENVSKSKVYGLEQTLLINARSWLDLETNLTWQNSINEDPRYRGNMLPDQPKFNIESSVGIGSIKGFRLRPAIEYKSLFYRDLANGKPVPSSDTLSESVSNKKSARDTKGTFHLSSTLSYEKDFLCIELQFLDILDNKKEQSYEDGYYTLLYPGRSIQGKCSIKF